MTKTKFDPVVFTTETTNQLLELAGLHSKAEVKLLKEEDGDVVEVSIDAKDETGLLIGAHGATLNAIQVFLGLALRQESQEWYRVVVNVGDWQEKQEEQLRILAEQAASRAVSTGEDQTLYNLTPAQRRTIHMILTEDGKVETLSEGEGAERHLIVRPKVK
jgi:spoIIIJ-associated protein